MSSKELLKKIYHVIQYIVCILGAGMGIYYFFISKNIFKEKQVLILWGLLGIINAGSIMNSKFLENNFSWKHNMGNIINVFISILIVSIEIKKLWL